MAGADVDALAILESNAVFAALPKDVVARLAALAKIERFEQRSLLVSKGQSPEHIRYVLEGSVDLTMTTPHGKATSLPAFPGTWATWLSCMSEQPMQWDMWNSRSAAFLALPRRQVRAAICDCPMALLQVIEYMGAVQRALMAWALNVSLQSPQKRLAYFLLMTSQGGWLRPQLGGGSTPYTQEQLGNLGLGSRQRVGRLLRELEELDLVEVKYGGVSVSSWEKLKAYVFN